MQWRIHQIAFSYPAEERIDAKSRLRSVSTARDLAEAVGSVAPAISRYLNGGAQAIRQLWQRLQHGTRYNVDHLQGLTGDPRRPGYSSLPSVLLKLRRLLPDYQMMG